MYRCVCSIILFININRNNIKNILSYKNNNNKYILFKKRIFLVTLSVHPLEAFNVYEMHAIRIIS